VQAALENASQGRTTITIAHRLSTIRDAHNIVVMNKGEIIEQGTHKQLLDMKGFYYNLVSAQSIEDTNKAKVEALMEPLDDEEEKLIRRMSRWKNVGGYLTDPADVADNHALRHNRASRASIGGRKSLKSMRSVKSVSDSAIQRRGALTVEEPNYNLRTVLAFIAGFNKKEWYWLLVGLILSIICGGATPTQSVFFAKQVDTLSVIEFPGIDRWAIQDKSNFWSLMYLMLGGVQFLSNFGQGWALGICGEWLGRRVRLQTFSSLLRQDVSFYDQEKNNAGALVTFLVVESSSVIGISGTTLGTILISITSVFTGIFVSTAIGWKLALVCTSVMPIVIACGYFRTKMLEHFNQRTREVNAASASYAAENISQMKTVASLTREDQVAAKYIGELDAQQRRSLISVSKSSILFAASQSVMFLCFALGFYYGSTLMATMEYNQFQFYVCFNSIIMGAQSAGAFFSFAPDMAKAKGAAINIKRLFERKPAIDTWEPEGRRLERVKGHIEFKNVHFRYPTRPDTPVLRGVNLKIRPGQYVAFVGASGCGKSTSIGLLERFYDPLVGQVLIDGHDVSKVNVNDYRSHIALVSQEPTLYQGTIRENICMGSLDEDVSDERIEKACRDANIYEFVMSLPEGLNTMVGMKGGLLSGGQKQRIAIARALIREPKILLLDEATSALDSESEHIVQAALDKAAQGRTTITIAHRLSTVQHADVIFVFDAGRVVEAGTHSELMELNGRYAELVHLQNLGTS
jgi:ATP-binding cassette subfamily B (MDR/TAP) protein 1